MRPIFIIWGVVILFSALVSVKVSAKVSVNLESENENHIDYSLLSAFNKPDINFLFTQEHIIIPIYGDQYAVNTEQDDTPSEPQSTKFEFITYSSEPDYDGLVSDTQYFLGYQFGVVAILFFAPQNVSNWSEEQKRANHLKKYWDNITGIKWDSDEWYINYIMHPYFGAAYFVRARERGYAPQESFYYSILLSTIWEFGIEAFAEPVSIQDIIVTPFFGSLLGEYFMMVRSNIKRRGIINRSFGDKVIMALTDPIGSLNNAFRRWWGWNTHLEVEVTQSWNNQQNTIPELIDPQNYHTSQYNHDAVGLRFKLSW